MYDTYFLGIWSRFTIWKFKQMARGVGLLSKFKQRACIGNVYMNPRATSPVGLIPRCWTEGSYLAIFIWTWTPFFLFFCFFFDSFTEASFWCYKPIPTHFKSLHWDDGRAWPASTTIVRACGSEKSPPLTYLCAKMRTIRECTVLRPSKCQISSIETLEKTDECHI